MERKVLFYKVFRALVIFVLISSLIGSVILQIIKLNKEETTISTREVQGIHFPVLTICPDVTNQSLIPGENKTTTFEDLNEIIAQTKTFYSANLLIDLGSGLQKRYNLKNTSSLINDTPLKLTQILQKSDFGV